MSEMASSNDPDLSGRSPPSTADDTTYTNSTAINPFAQSSGTLVNSSHAENTTIQDHPRTTQPACPPTSCYFLDKVPIEVRILIYRCMLCNPILAEFPSVGEDDKTEVTTDYGLLPNILATCKQISQEASSVLYEDNTFFVAFVPDIDYAGSPHILSPLTKFNNKAHFSTISRVRSWKIMLLGKVRTYKDAISIFTRFCIAISDSRLKSLELLLVPSRDYGFVKLNTYGGSGRYRHLIRPLQNLRKIENFRYRAVTLSEVPVFDHLFPGAVLDESYDFTTKLRKNDAELQGLKKLGQEDHPSGFLAKMYNSLVSRLVL